MEIKNPNRQHQESLSRLDHLALFVTEHIGTMGFFFIIAGWTILWLSWNIFAPKDARFDPFPAFVLWLFISNLIQLHLMPLIMIGQNLQGRHAELRAEHDYNVDKHAAAEIAELKRLIEENNKLLRDLRTKLK